MPEPLWRQRRGDQFITTVTGWNATATGALVVVLIAASWAGSYVLGGSKTVGPQLFHIPVVLAAGRFGGRGATVSAVVAGVVCGPLLALDVADGSPQSLGNWTGRLLIFLVVGHLTAALHARSLAATHQRLEDSRNRHRVDQAIDGGDIVPVYQPIVSTLTGRVEGVEALARWRAPDGSLTLPAEFIPDAERTGAIVAIDRAILAQACAQLAEWRRTDVVDEGFHVSVNLSADHLECDDLVAVVRATLDRHGIAPANLMLEVTETALVHDPAGAAACLHALRELGVTVALDDFGVGQSSLSNLARFPFDVYKIDRSFVVGLELGPRGAALVSGVIDLAGTLSLDGPIAEGIETPEQLHRLIELGCTRGQGYLLGRPAGADDIKSVLRRGPVLLPEI